MQLYTKRVYPTHKIATQLYNHFFAQDDPPTDQLRVPVDKIKEHSLDANRLTAMLIYIGNYPTKKVHVPIVSFQVDKQGNVLLPTLQYE